MEIAQIKIGADMQHLQRGPADQENCAQYQATNENQPTVRAKRRGRQGDRPGRSAEARRIFCCRKEANEMGPPLSQYSIEERERDSMHEACDGEYADQKHPPTAQAGANDQVLLNVLSSC